MRAAAILMCGLMAWLTAGCRTSRPDVEPAKQPEVLSVPPMHEMRYNVPNYPKEAFNNQDLFRRRDLEGTNPIMPTRGMMGPGGNMNPGRP